jgi:hypothetical protein
MTLNVARETAALERLTVLDLRARYAEVFGEPTNARHKGWLIKRIAWRLQARAEGGLSDRARRRAEELADEADLRLSPPRSRSEAAASDAGVVATAGGLAGRGDGRLPPPGSVLTRLYKGATLRVRVLERGFEHDGVVYRSLSAAAKAITGTHCNGYLFFRIDEGGRR